jgi:hypothetical protein
MPRLRALTSWAGRSAGDEFDASDEDARLLCAADLPGGPKAEIIDRVMQAADSALTGPDKRRYLRRDLRAQK